MSLILNKEEIYKRLTFRNLKIKPYKHNLGLIHGLITCKKCSNVWNRNSNGATNIYKNSRKSFTPLKILSFKCL